MRAPVLVSTNPGGGPDVADAVEDDEGFDRALATLDSFEALTEGLRAVQALDGVADALTLVEAPA